MPNILDVGAGYSAEQICAAAELRSGQTASYESPYAADDKKYISDRIKSGICWQSYGLSRQIILMEYKWSFMNCIFHMCENDFNKYKVSGHLYNYNHVNDVRALFPSGTGGLWCYNGKVVFINADDEVRFYPAYFVELLILDLSVKYLDTIGQHSFANRQRNTYKEAFAKARAIDFNNKCEPIFYQCCGNCCCSSCCCGG